MQQSFNKMEYLVGDAGLAANLPFVPAKELFVDDICVFLNKVSRALLKDPKSRAYSDVISLGFWLRKASTAKLKERFLTDDGNLRLGRGVAFHIAPSNVPVNFAYSLAAGLLTGNSNIVRVPSKDFPQARIIVEAVNRTLREQEGMRPYIVLVRYGRDKEINDVLSGMADTRIVWADCPKTQKSNLKVENDGWSETVFGRPVGGDATIAQLRRSELPPRSTEVTFADRYSFCVIDSDTYMECEDKDKVAQDFYNDTYFNDQNACTSPRVVVWTGDRKEEAKKIFWGKELELVRKKYAFQSIQGINKLTSSYLAAAALPGTKIEQQEDNLLVRVKVSAVSARLMDLKDNSGYFFEYDCEDVLDLKPLCDDKRCQTIGLYGSKEILMPLLKSGIRGVDRVVPLGKTMDFDLLWDGYDLFSQLTRVIKL